GIRDGHVTGVQTCALPISADDLDWRAAAPATRGTDLIARAQAAAAIAAKYASDVDKTARFPSEAIMAAREERLLGALVPSALGEIGRASCRERVQSSGVAW